MNATEHYQRTFAAHLRNPDVNSPPQGVDAQRIGVYTKLLFNNVDDFLRSCFPVLRSILDDAQWNTLVRQFYAGHACQTPYFREIPGEFVQWLSATDLSNFPPFLLELAHYEWVEIPLSLDDSETDWNSIDPDGDLLDGQLALNPVMLLQTYQYPVHKISADCQPQTPEPTHLLLLRNTAGKITFVELNAVTARLLQLLQEGTNARAALGQLAQEMQHPDPQQLMGFGVHILKQLQAQQALLGVIKT
ncbi:MAG: putative DNA-binding domain-containing protein [Thiothrix sp.]|uniref:HvfC family RiPP maturation protein n=1 Tax=Thiothrix sp. TaxID=1032 RepID=UPI00263138A2|nr:putative DNA-binding domain-containing protein [Thiothrix sp.]MDD5391398.1 putative DNA-binding domain-containing protein [Thiothrix sp.]